MATRQASCSCGQLKAEATGDPIRVSMCHCIACQRRTGSVFGVQARFARENIRVQGEAKQYTRIADSGNAIHFSFCPTCGATVYYVLEQFPDVIAVPVGAFADPSFPAPNFSVYESRRHDWAAAPEAAERFQ